MRVRTAPLFGLLLSSSLACATCVVVAGCDRGPGKLAPATDKLDVSSSDSANAEVWKIARDGEASFVMEGKVETVRGELSKTRGQLEIDLADLTRTRGTVEIDLLTLETKTFKEPGKNAKQTVDALTWLEVAKRTGNEANRAKHQWAAFAIRSIDKADPANLDAQTGDNRTSMITATGEFLLHGRKSLLTVQLKADFDFSEGKPVQLEIETVEPLVVNLAAHDVKPRDHVGKLVAKVGEVLKAKVADDAKITFELDATPTGKKLNLPPAPAAPPAPPGPALKTPPPAAPGEKPGETAP